jgi:hypothetical protein
MANQDSATPTVLPTLTTRKQERFAFFDAHGGPLSPDYRDACKEMPFGKRLFFNANWWAFFFGPFYFYARGMWKKGTVVLVVLLAYFVTEISLGVPKEYHWVGTWTSFVVMWTANWADFLKTTENRESWNPFQAFKRNPAA